MSRAGWTRRGRDLRVRPGQFLVLLLIVGISRSFASDSVQNCEGEAPGVGGDVSAWVESTADQLGLQFQLADEPPATPGQPAPLTVDSPEVKAELVKTVVSLIDQGYVLVVEEDGKSKGHFFLSTDGNYYVQSDTGKRTVVAKGEVQGFVAKNVRTIDSVLKPDARKAIADAYAQWRRNQRGGGSSGSRSGGGGGRSELDLYFAEIRQKYGIRGDDRAELIRSAVAALSKLPHSEYAKIQRRARQYGLPACNSFVETVVQVALTEVGDAGIKPGTYAPAASNFGPRLKSLGFKPIGRGSISAYPPSSTRILVGIRPKRTRNGNGHILFITNVGNGRATVAEGSLVRQRAARRGRRGRRGGRRGGYDPSKWNRTRSVSTSYLASYHLYYIESPDGVDPEKVEAALADRVGGEAPKLAMRMTGDGTKSGVGDGRIDPGF